MARTRSEKIPIVKPVPFKVAKLKITPIVAHVQAPKLSVPMERMAKMFGNVKPPGRRR